jgi:carbon storage regulator
MLVLTRKLGEEIVIADSIRVKVLEIRGNKVRLGIVAPDKVSIHRAEVQARRQEFAAADFPVVVGSGI